MNHEQPPAAREPTSTDVAQQPGQPQIPSAEEHEQQRIAPPRIWVASLSDYNNGHLHGRWIDAAREPEELQADIDAMLAASPWAARTGEPAEEWGIFDHDNFGPLRIGEYENISHVSAVARGIAEHGLAFAAWADVIQDEEQLAGFDEAYLGHYDDLHTYLEQLLNDLGYDRILDEALPASIRPYVKIDITATVHDLILGGDLHAIPAPDGGVWIFHG